MPKFDEWYYTKPDILRTLKKGTINNERDFLKQIDNRFTQYYRPLRSCVNKLRKLMFPNGQRRAKEDVSVFSQMKSILQSAQLDPAVICSEST